MCLSVTALAGATRTLRPQLWYQKKALDARIKTDGIELKVLIVSQATPTPAGATRALLPQLRYQNNDARIKLKDGIELKFLVSQATPALRELARETIKFLSSKVTTVCSSPQIL